MPTRLTTLVYVRRGAYTLMLRRTRAHDPLQGKWNGLGGKLEPGESPEECMRREVLEESGLSVKEAELKGVITFPGFDGGTDVFTFVFVVTGFSGEPRSSAEGDLFWVTTELLADLDLWEGDRHFLPWLTEPGWFSASFVYSGGRYVSHEVTHYGGNQGP
ncbi:MAG: 8-oxo-dGTP diphosphatase [Trueperaceae bacterium]|nr:8-oxo-dGTP diphosphatase [Trueperaceae bacterium]HRQ09642.1 8-oxo-dGTP diphosphatase [Trueperaceae bacterium]